MRSCAPGNVSNQDHRRCFHGGLSRCRRGLTILEVGISLVLLALIGGSTLLVMASLFGGTGKLEEDQVAAVELETLSEVFRLRAEAEWPTDVSATGTISEYNYRVEDEGLMADPTGSPAPLTVKRLRIRLDYSVQARGGTIDKSEEVIIFVGQ